MLESAYLEIVALTEERKAFKEIFENNNIFKFSFKACFNFYI